VLTGAVDDERVRKYKEEALKLAKQIVREIKQLENPRYILDLIRDFEIYIHEIEKIQEGRVK